MFYVLCALRLSFGSGWFSTEGITEPNLGDALDLVALVPWPMSCLSIAITAFWSRLVWRVFAVAERDGYRGALRSGRPRLPTRRLPRTGFIVVPSQCGWSAR